MLSEGVLKIDFCLYLEDDWPMDDEDLKKIRTLWTSADIPTMFALSVSNFVKKEQKAMYFLRVNTRKSETSLRRLMAFILIKICQKISQQKVIACAHGAGSYQIKQYLQLERIRSLLLFETK